MPKVSVYRGRNLLFEHWIEADEVVLGRGQDVDIPLDTQMASRRHCRIVRKQNAWMLEELGAKNGLFVNGRYCNVKRLAHNDRIEVADLMIVFHRPKSEARREAGVRRGDANAQFRLSQKEIEQAVVGNSGPVKRNAFSGMDNNALTQGVTPEQLAELKAQMEAKREAHLEYTASNGRRLRLVLNKKRYVLGFDDDCDINLGKRVWPWGKHAVEVVQLPNGGYQARRLSRWVAVKIGDERLGDDHTLADKQVLSIAGFRVRYLGRSKLAGPQPGDRGKKKPAKKSANLATLGPGSRGPRRR